MLVALLAKKPVPAGSRAADSETDGEEASQSARQTPTNSAASPTSQPGGNWARAHLGHLFLLWLAYLRHNFLQEGLRLAAARSASSYQVSYPCVACTPCCPESVDPPRSCFRIIPRSAHSRGMQMDS